MRYYRRQTATLDLDPFDQLVVAVESLLFEHRYDDRTTVLDRFVTRRRDVDTRRGLIDSWNDSVHGYFEILDNGHDQVLLINLLDELTYTCYASMGGASVAALEPGGFVMTRVLPVGDQWLLSGSQRYFPATTRPEIAGLALQLSLKRPGLVLRNPDSNPDKRRQAERNARWLHESFLDCFGTDRTVVQGSRVAETYQRFIDHHAARIRARATEPRPTPPRMSVTDDPAYTEQFAAADSVGIVHREDSGIWFFVGYDVVASAFADPTTLADPRVAEQINGYLEDDTIPRWLLDDLHDRHPDHVDEVWATVLNRPGFGWSRDGSELLDRHKPDDLTGLAPGCIPSPSIALEQLTSH
ncbi:MAG: hypothetical protein L0H79_19270 [Intrasporangium sp.]|uniref:hypothetical protein n=1 Tax=Intrasporangium sp. TaxID=1925024 RepID=UPI002649F4C1|nr:hypothetical protein [Intrasporangium sp.]MDN5797867.1 hypothetical protein [Intrasporangium sp.]